MAAHPTKRTLEQFAKLPRITRDSAYQIAHKTHPNQKIGAKELWEGYDTWISQSIKPNAPWHGGHRGPILED
jgi:hypothetical protein